MAIIDRFKRKKESKVKEKEKIETSPDSGKDQKRPAKKTRKKVPKIAFGVLLHPYVTEKTTDQSLENKYTFKIFKKANKSEVKRAVEEVYGVKALEVKIINVPRKKRRFGKTTGWRKGYKKAIVKIKEGQKIELG